MMAISDRRQHKRLAIRLPLELRLAGRDDSSVHRTISRDISAGGISFEIEADEIRVGTRFVVDLIVPPGDGYFPYPGRVRGRGEVLRVEPRVPAASKSKDSSPGFRIAGQFKEPLEVEF